METHDNDPTTDERVDPWNTFHADLSGLGKRLRETYQKVSGEEGPSEDEIRDAFGTLLGAWDRVAESVATALRDPEVRERLKGAAGSFATALGTTISELGTELGDSPDSSAAAGTRFEEE